MIPAVSSRCTASGSHSDAVFPVLAIKIRDISICLSPPCNPVFYCCSLLYNISFYLSTSKFLTFDKIRQNPTRFSKFSDAMHSLGKRCVKLCAVLPLFYALIIQLQFFKMDRTEKSLKKIKNMHKISLTALQAISLKTAQCIFSFRFFICAISQNLKISILPLTNAMRSCILTRGLEDSNLYHFSNG